MSYNLERQAIEGLLSSNWTDLTVIVTYDNVPTQQPIAGKMLELQILHSTSSPAEIGGSGLAFNRYHGLVSADISVPENTGTKVLSEIIDAFSAIYRRKKVSPATGHYLTFGIPYVKNIGVFEGRRHSIVYVPFYRDSLE